MRFLLVLFVLFPFCISDAQQKQNDIIYLQKDATGFGRTHIDVTVTNISSIGGLTMTQYYTDIFGVKKTNYFVNGLLMATGDYTIKILGEDSSAIRSESTDLLIAE